MPEIPMAAHEVLERYFLEARAKLLEVAATLDRIDRAAGSAELKDERRGQLDRALAVLREREPNRAERLQQLFSRPYAEGWMDSFGIDKKN